MIQIESTYKHKDVEEFIDIYFFRPVGYWLALGSKALRLTPNAVTILGMVLGIISGHLFYYTSMNLNVLGIFLKIFSNALDSADGQLARMTQAQSRLGRILDGLSSGVIFLSIYFHLCLRYVHAGNSPWIFLVALVAGYGHFIQSAWGDFFRNGYLYFVKGPEFCEVDSISLVKDQYLSMEWNGGFLKKAIKYIELQYIKSTHVLTRRFWMLRELCEKNWGKEVPPWLAQEYSRTMRVMNMYYNILTINVRQFTLFALVLMQRPELFFVFELVVLTAVFFYAVLIQERKLKHLISLVRSKITDASGLPEGAPQ